jgi:hypothetical protein
MKSGTRVIIGDEEVQFQWGDRQFIKMIKLSKQTTYQLCNLHQGFHQFKLFAANIRREDSHIVCFDTHIIPDDGSMVQGDHITEALGEPHQSDLTEGDPQTLNNRGTTPEIGSTPMAEPNQSHLITDFEAFKANLPQHHNMITSKRSPNWITPLMN